MSPEIPLQQDMFTGALVDTRTNNQRRSDYRREQPQQTEMFSQRDIAQFGVSAHPVMDVSPGKLVLISEDSRTEEEKLHDLQREAEALTNPMFDKLHEADEDANGTAPLEPEEAESPQPSPDQSEATKLKAYHALVQAVEEQITTIWVDKPYENQFKIHLAMMIFEAHRAGLSLEEIEAAIQIGTSLGHQKRAEHPTSNNGILYDARHNGHQHRSVRIGFRSRQRQLSTYVRRRAA